MNLIQTIQKVKKRRKESFAEYRQMLFRQKEFLEYFITYCGERKNVLLKYLSGSSELERGLILDTMNKWDTAIKLYEKVIRRVMGQLDTKRQPRSSCGITDDMIAIAKQYPIEDLLPNPVKHNKTLCCFHDERTPSMGIKNNRVHCFGACGKSWDTIAFIEDSKGIGFIEAVRYLTW